MAYCDYQAGKLTVDAALWSFGVDGVFIVMADADILLRVSAQKTV